MAKFNEITKEEKDLIYSYMLFPIVRRLLERDMKAIEVSGVKFKEPYIRVIDDALKKLSHDLRDVKSEMWKLQIKMIRHGDLDYEAVVRGWTHQVVLHPNLAREWVEERILGYIKNHP